MGIEARTYPGLSGSRLEDVVLVTTKSPRNLTKFEKVREVRHTPSRCDRGGQSVTDALARHWSMSP